MRCLALVALLMLAAYAAAAQNISATISPYLVPGETYTAEEFTAAGRQYALINVGGSPSFMLQKVAGDYSLVENATDILSAMDAKKRASMNLDARVGAIETHIKNFNFSRQPKEQLCKQYTGLIILYTDRVEERPCLYNTSLLQPLESCLLACRTVPICYTALANNLPAIYAIFYFSNATDDLDANVSAALNSMAGVRQLDENSIEAAFNAISKARNARDRIASNGLFSAYDFCAAITFNSTALDVAYASLNTIKDDATYLAGLPAVAERMESLTAERKKLVTKEGEYAQTLYDSAVRINATRFRVAVALARIDDDFTLTTLATAENAYARLTNSVASKDFLAADIAYHDFTVAAENADNAASEIIDNYGGLHAILANCTRGVYVAEKLDKTDEYADEIDNFLGRLGTHWQELNATPMKMSAFLALESKVKSTCRQAGTTLRDVGGGINKDKSDAVQRNLKEAQNLSAYYSQPLNDSEVQSLVRQADNLMEIANFEAAGVFYEKAITKSGELVSALKVKGAAIDDAQAAIMKGRAEINETRTSWKYMLLKPDVGSAEDELDEAEDELYTNPAKAKEKAQDALSKIEGSKASTDVAIFTLVLGIGGVLVVVTIFAIAMLYIWYKRRGRKQTELKKQIEEIDRYPEEPQPAAPVQRSEERPAAPVQKPEKEGKKGAGAKRKR